MGMRKSRSAVMRALAFLLPLTMLAAALVSCGHGTPVTLAPAHASSPVTAPSPAALRAWNAPPRGPSAAVTRAL